MKKRGRKRLPRVGSYGRWLHDREKYGKIDAFIASLIAADPIKRGAVRRAEEAAYREFDIKDRTTIQRARAKLRPWHKVNSEIVETLRAAAAEIEKRQAFIEEQFSERELVELLEVGVPLVTQLAAERAELKRLRAVVNEGRRRPNGRKNIRS